MNTRSISIEFRSLDEQRRSIDCVASTDAIDSYGESVSQDSWKLDRFNANPVVLYAHNSRELPIGTAERVRVEGGALRCTIRFCTAAENPKAEQVWQMVRSKTLRAVSVGFVPGSIRVERRAGVDVNVLADNELLELSVVPIPANPEALMRARAAGHESAAPPSLAELLDPPAASTAVDRELRAFGLDAPRAAAPARTKRASDNGTALAELLDESETRTRDGSAGASLADLLGGGDR